MRLLYGTTTSLVVTLTDRYHGSCFRLYFADAFNAVQNPRSSNPFLIFLEYRDMVEHNDITNPKYLAHVNGVRRGTRNRQQGVDRREALHTIRRMGIHAVAPYLAMLEVEAYENNHGTAVVPRSPAVAGSPTAIEYLVDDIRGPNQTDPELHLQRLH